MVSDLEAAHPLWGLQPSLPWSSWESTQVSALASFLSSYSSVLDSASAITHSNGGLVLREYVRTHPSSKVKGHLSIGTPHLGSKLAETAITGELFYTIAALTSEIMAPFLYYRQHDPGWDTLVVTGQDIETLDEVWAQDLSDFVALIPVGVAAFGYTLWDPWDVLFDLMPNSGFLNALNSSSALTTESQRLSVARVSISTEYPDDLAPWRSFTPTDVAAVQVEALRQTLIFFALELYYYYLFHENTELSSSAYIWEDLAYDLAEIPLIWKRLTGAQFSLSDGIVPQSSSDYPQGTNLYHPQSLSLVHHRAQLDARNHGSDPYRQLISQAIEERLNITESEPDPIELDVEIQGPTVIPPDASCTWYAVVSGGSAPYSYQWYNDGSPAGNGSSYTGGNEPSNPSNQFTLQLNVGSGDPGEGSAILTVSEDISAPPCFS